VGISKCQAGPGRAQVSSGGTGGRIADSWVTSTTTRTAISVVARWIGSSANAERAFGLVESALLTVTGVGLSLPRKSPAVVLHRSPVLHRLSEKDLSLTCAWPQPSAKRPNQREENALCSASAVPVGRWINCTLRIFTRAVKHFAVHLKGHCWVY
jgi:hypothetical protein